MKLGTLRDKPAASGPFSINMMPDDSSSEQMEHESLLESVEADRSAVTVAGKRLMERLQLNLN